MTKTGNPSCYLCETAVAEAIKLEVELVQNDDDDCSETAIVTRNPICLACADQWFDGTETYPALLPLA